MGHRRSVSTPAPSAGRAVAGRAAFRAAIVLPGMLLALLGLAAPAAAVDLHQKLTVLASFTQTSAGSYQSWNSARQNQDQWADYRFDWSTDHCSASPDQPLGFDFRLACHRHDFGYRNYKAVDQFKAHKVRLDDAFYADLKRRCGGYQLAVRPACLSLAWTYYQAVRTFGSVIVEQADLDRAAALKAAGLRAAATG